jgi:hypothetical protein
MILAELHTFFFRDNGSAFSNFFRFRQISDMGMAMQNGELAMEDALLVGTDL